MTLAAPQQLIDQFSRPPSSVTIYSPTSSAGPSHTSTAPTPSLSLLLGSHQLSHEPAAADFHDDEPTLPPAATFAPSLFVPLVGFHSLLPVIFQGLDHKYISAPGTASLKANGTTDFKAHNFIVLAIGKLSPFSPSWQTIFLHGDYIQSDRVQANTNGGLPIPLNKIPLGGRNSMLYSPFTTPMDEAGLTHLFTTLDKFAHACGFANHIRYTPPELRSEFYSLTLA